MVSGDLTREEIAEGGLRFDRWRQSADTGLGEGVNAAMLEAWLVDNADALLAAASRDLSSRPEIDPHGSLASRIHEVLDDTHTSGPTGTQALLRGLEAAGLTISSRTRPEHDHHRTDGGPEPTGEDHDQMYPNCSAPEGRQAEGLSEGRAETLNEIELRWRSLGAAQFHVWFGMSGLSMLREVVAGRTVALDEAASVIVEGDCWRVTTYDAEGDEDRCVVSLTLDRPPPVLPKEADE